VPSYLPGNQNNFFLPRAVPLYCPAAACGSPGWTRYVASGHQDVKTGPSGQIARHATALQELNLMVVVHMHCVLRDGCQSPSCISRAWSSHSPKSNSVSVISKAIDSLFSCTSAQQDQLNGPAQGMYALEYGIGTYVLESIPLLLSDKRQRLTVHIAANS
jgi:hypothetical protein